MTLAELPRQQAAGTDDQRSGGRRVDDYEVLALRYGTLRADKRELYHRYESYGEPDAVVEMAYYFWLLRNASETVLVDTGFAPAVGVARGRSCLSPPLHALSAIGVAPESISTVLITHFHYDHIGNLDAFPHAQLVAPRAELDFWTGPMASRSQFAAHVERSEIERIRVAAEQGRVRLIDGREQVLPGVSAIVVGGHSPGQTVLVVERDDGDVVLASDAVHFYEELELDRPFGVVCSLEEMYAAYDLLRELGSAPGAVVVPGHDPLVQSRFPALAESGGVAVRVQAGR